MASQYDDNSVRASKGANRVRTKPAVMLGSATIEGARHTVKEIYGNSLDEATGGFGDHLIIQYYEDSSISIRDFGRGVPLGWNEGEQNWNWHLVYNDLYAGAKASKYQRELKAVTDWSKFDISDYPYLFAVGTNGLGGASTQYSSEWFEAYSYRDGVCKWRRYEKGMPIVDGKPVDMFAPSLTLDEIKAMKENISATTEPNGTLIHWLPDKDVFSGEFDIGSAFLEESCEAIACTAQISVTYINHKTGVTKEYEPKTLEQLMMADHPSISDVIKAYSFNRKTLFGQRMLEPDGSIIEDPIALCETTAYIGIGKDIQKQTAIKCFHNCVSTSMGVQYAGARTAIDTWLKPKCSARGFKIKDSDYEEYVACYVATKANVSTVRGQTKDGLDDIYIQEYLQNSIINTLEVEYAKGNKGLMNLVDLACNNARARLERAELQDVAKAATKVMQKVKLPDKFTSCIRYEQKDDNCEIWITEGDSANGAVKNARSREFQATFPIRGKGLNPLKATLKRILENKEITELFKLLGCGMIVQDEKTGKVVIDTFDIKKLRFNKIIIATDADEDGYQIRVLLFLVFYKLARPLLTGGYVYIAETPRFMLTLSDGSKLFAKNDAERDQLKKQYGFKIASIGRFKGLGEVPYDILRETTVLGANRNLVQVEFDDMLEENHRFIRALFGKDPLGERKLILSSLLGISADLIESEFVDFDTTMEVQQETEEGEVIEVEESLDAKLD